MRRYVSGSASADNGADLVKVSKHGVVVVSIQHRLGVFGASSYSRGFLSKCAYFACCVGVYVGFLAGKEVKTGGSLNAGLRAFMHSSPPSPPLLLL